MGLSRSPSPKRVKLDPDSPRILSPTRSKLDPSPDASADQMYGPLLEEEVEEDQDRCSICLQGLIDRTVVPICAHEFCFDCLIVWTEQSRRCPLCSQGIGPFLIHKIRSRYDYQKHYLNPLPTSPVSRPLPPLAARQNRAPRRRAREREWGRRATAESDEADRLDRSIAKRKWIYEHDLYAKHVASNAYTRYRPYPSPQQFAASPEYIARTTMFLRRELQVWVNLDVEFLTTFIISIMKAIDIRSESAVKLLSEFLDLDAPYVEGGRHVNAEHFAHEVYSYVRSPYKDLFVYDSVVQYEVTPDVPPPREEPRRRWREASRSRSPAAQRTEDTQPARDTRGQGTRRRRLRHSRSSSSSRSGHRRPTSRDRELNEHTSRGSDGWRQSIGRSTNHHPDHDSIFPTGGADLTDARMQKDQPDLSPITPGPTTKTAEDSKGKARYISEPDASEEERLGSAVLPGESAAELNELPAVAEVSRRPIRVRNRSLFESVHAHLSAPLRKRETKIAAVEAVPSSSSKFLATSTSKKEAAAGSVPSLLTRLSDPDTLRPIYTNLNGQYTSGLDSGATPCLEENPSTEIPAREEDSFAGSHPERTFSAPEIMARTRARLNRLSALQTPFSIDGSVDQPSASISLGSRQDGNGVNAENTGRKESPRRAKLLGRLEEEKLKAEEAQRGRGSAESTSPGSAEPVASDRISQVEKPVVVSTDSFTRSAEDVDAVEARLRRQAQLRVRLAAEKRQHAIEQSTVT
ncbi:E3 ubiquitin-protein ligase Topors [Favolaschia claudopus]|uniref:RING-type E3 ubiquitin transferase n=1 Tax=Favolaschia claudopus TaxID=2862362 RepID=A0AAW0CGC8_9AGAR